MRHLFEREPWTVDVDNIGAHGWHVTPGSGLLVTRNWAINPHHRHGVANLLAQLWRVTTGAYLRREFPKSERALRKAIAECEIYCRHENDAENRNAAVAKRVLS